MVVIATHTNINRLFHSQYDKSHPDFDIKDIEESFTDFDRAISEEVLRQQYRNAIRIFYLKTIHTLSSLRLIEYSKEKTNLDYQHELRDQMLLPGFLALTAIYNNVWYGYHAIDTSRYQQYAESFNQFLNGLNA